MKEYSETFNPEKVFKWADKYISKKKQLPTLRAACKRFKCSLDDIESAVYDYDGERYFGIAVAHGTYSGVADIESRSNFLLEVE